VAEITLPSVDASSMQPTIFRLPRQAALVRHYPPSKAAEMTAPFRSLVDSVLYVHLAQGGNVKWLTGGFKRGTF
jgi:hypothetical protein